jgi:hypothetical protein
MSSVRALRKLSVLACALSVLATAALASAHVAFLTPPPVENENDPNAPKTPPKVLKFGSTFKLSWEVLILHDPEDFDLDLLKTKDGAATTIVHGLSPDTLEYEWTVPDMACTNCLLRVTQNNTINTDYTGFAPVTLSATGGTSSDPEPAPGDGGNSSEPDPGNAGNASGGTSSGGRSSGGTSTSAGSSTTPEKAKAGDGGGCNTSGRPAPASPLALALFAAAALSHAARRSRRVTD